MRLCQTLNHGLFRIFGGSINVNFLIVVKLTKSVTGL